MRRNRYFNEDNWRWRSTQATYRQACELLNDAIKMLSEDHPHPDEYYQHEDFIADSLEWLNHMEALRKGADYIGYESVALLNLIEKHEEIERESKRKGI